MWHIFKLIITGKLSQSIYWVESILSKCHEEGDLLFFTIRAEPTHVSFEANIVS